MSVRLDENKRAIKPDVSSLGSQFSSYEILNRRVLQPSAVARRDRSCLRKIRFCLEGGSLMESVATSLMEFMSFHSPLCQRENIVFLLSFPLL